MTKQRADKYELIFGSNRIVNCGSVIKIEGRGVNQEIIRLRRGGDGKLLLNCQVKDNAGNTLAKIHNSKPVHIDTNFECDVSEKHIIVREKKSGEIYLEFQYLGGNRLKINGIFWIQGKKIIASDDGLQIGGILMKDNTFQSCGAAIGLG